jgi:lipid A 4'-phosphatase
VPKPNKDKARNSMTSDKNPFGALSSPVIAAGSLALWIALLIVFYSMPQWDLVAASWFFDPETCAATQRAAGMYCAGFTFQLYPLVSGIRELLHPVPAILGGILIVILLIELRGGMRWRNPGIRMKGVLIAALLLGPGLLVNGILKEFWGRPRPWMTEDFGGWLPFVEAGVNTDYCARNCSFVSGEAAAAGWLMCLSLLLLVKNRIVAGIAVAAISVVMALFRVAFGAHYLSDAVLGFTSTIVIFLMLAAISEMTAPRRG